jgi:uncharacterized protein YbaP (TraB family)
MTRPASFICALLLLWAPALAWAKPPVWVLHGRGATVTLFGSVHILPRDTDWEPDALKTALQVADELWFEVPIDPAALLDVSRMALAEGMLPEGESLQGKMSPEGRARLARAAETYRLPLPQLDRLRPWLAELTVTSAAMAKEGASADQGVERQLAETASKAARRAFETPAQQIALFADAAETDQIDSLQDTLEELEEDPQQSSRLIAAWMAGDLMAIDREGVEALRRSNPAIFKRLLTNRNLAWQKVLLRRLNAHPARGKRPAKLVVVVGVGHLAGKGGLPELLRKRGVRVDGPRSY